MLKRVALTFLIASSFLMACAEMDKSIFDTTSRPPTTQVDVYQDGKTPNRRYREIGELLMRGKREDELIRLNDMLAEVRKLGGNGLIYSHERAGFSGNAFGVSEEHVFKGKVIIYE